MRRRILASVLLAALLLFLIPAGTAEASDEICFLSVNDTLLDLGSMPVFVNGTAYIPNWIFANFKIYFSSFDNVTVSLYTLEKQLYFNINEGTAFDGSGNSFPAKAIYRNGQVYVSAASVCSFFGLTCSYISGKGYGNILRVKDASAVLSDKNFLSAATPLMKSRYNEYMNSIETPSPSPSVPPGVTPSPSPDVSRRGVAVYLGFFGLPGDGVLDLLSGYGVTACFFLTAEDVLESPDTVRRLLASGHRAGVLCGEDPGSDYQETSALIFEAAQEKTLFVAAYPEYSEALRQWALENSMACVDFDIMSLPGSALSARNITGRLEASTGSVFLCFGAGEADAGTLSRVLEHLAEYEYSLPPLQEGDAA